jgi:histidinol-phosphatase (PHP family)
MAWTNYHTHTFYCDGKDEPEAYVKEAIKLDMPVLGFSGHAPVPFRTEWNMLYSKLDEYLGEIQRLKNQYQDKIVIYSGLEADYVDGVTDTGVFRDKVDYIIGGIHFLGQYDNGKYFEADHTPASFECGLENIFSGNIRNMVEYYYRQVNAMLTTNPPDVVAHLDLIKKFNRDNKFFNPEEKWHQELVQETIINIAASGCIVEVNTRGVYKKLKYDFYPDRKTLQICREQNIPVTISADAHRPAELNNHFEQAAKLLLDIGYKEICIFNDNRWKPVDFSPWGVKL